MTSTSRVLLYDGAPARSEELHARLAERGFAATRLALDGGLQPDVVPTTGDLAVVLLDPRDASGQSPQLQAVLHHLVDQKVATLVYGAALGMRRGGGPLVEWLDADASLDEVAAKIGTLARYAPLIKGLERELCHLHRLGQQLNRYFGEIDQEMRLAGRLQRDFLPRELPSVAPFSFEIFYRPASWVSGDMYDVFRIDECHVAMFVADAMGHGVAAGLLTMFLRQALVAKRIAGNSYSIVRPAEALENLHTCLLKQQLPNSQFVTAAYGVVDTRSGEMTVARAGHPYPLHIRRGGRIHELRSGGGLLGLADVPSDFEETRVGLEPGDKVVFYTDGIEEVFVVPAPNQGGQPTFSSSLQHWAGSSAPEFVQAVGDYLDCREGSLHPADDITMLVMEVERDGEGTR